jgi:methionyl-tRNA formyltransferase
MSFRIVMLTNGLPYSLRILERLEQHQTKIAAVVCESRFGISHHLVKSNSLLRRLVGVPKAIVRLLKHVSEIRRRRREYAHYAEQVVLTGPLNSERMVTDLRMMRPDFIILGSIGIIKEPVIAAARHGVLNSHPGLLPWIRGTGVIGRAIERNIPVGATCHYVNAGIDRGAVIERRLLPINKMKTSLAELEEAADHLGIEMLVDLIVEQLAQGKIPAAFEQSAKFPICKWMSASERQAVDEEIQQGKAKALFDSWQTACINEDRFQLPADFDAQIS